jgi:serine/threonine-protein kinase
VPDPVVASSDSELRAHVERVLSPHYELDCEIGRGGMGIVYRAKDRRLKRTVAIKVLPPELAFRSEIKTRFLREAETAAQLNHPNIVDIYAVDEAEGLVYFVMAYITGDNLAKRLHDHGTLGVDETRRTLRDVADALAYAHERGVVHRDIKPDNILLDAQSGRPMVTDFGIARAVSDGDSRLTATGTAIGTPVYMSPEQAAGERQIDGRSDLYSLGIVGYQMLSGDPPFMANSTPAILVKHISERPTPIQQRRADTPDDLARVIMSLLEKDPANRLPSAAAVVTALDSGIVPTIARTSGGTGAGDLPPDRAPVPYGQAGAPPVYHPSTEELVRWQAPAVEKFRRKVAPYLFVNAVIVLASIFGDSSFFGVTVMWSIFMAFKYAKLWSDGYDWRDVFRQPRDRELIEVFEDAGLWLRALVDPKQRQILREQRAQRRLVQRSAVGLPAAARPGLMPGVSFQETASASGPYGDRVRRAETDKDEIIRLVSGMRQSDRSKIPDVSRSAVSLAERVRALASSLAELDRGGDHGGLSSIEEEIARLERAANPLDRVGSEERVRRLASLKRQRRALGDTAHRREAILAKLDTCVIALQNMKFDLIRLNSGGQTHQHVTALAMDAMHLADSVDSALNLPDDPRRANTQSALSRGAGRG